MITRFQGFATNIEQQNFIPRISPVTSPIAFSQIQTQMSWERDCLEHFYLVKTTYTFK